MVSIEIGLSVALSELAAGVAVGNLFTVTVPDWLSFVGTFAGVMLTFLAGAEVDVPQFRREWQGSILITRSPPRRIRPSAAVRVRRESRLPTLSDGCCGPRLDGDANR